MGKNVIKIQSIIKRKEILGHTILPYNDICNFPFLSYWFPRDE